MRYFLEKSYQLDGPFFTDTMVNAFTQHDDQIIIHRDYVGGSVSTYDDSGSLDLQGRVLLVPHLIGFYKNTALFLYVPDQSGGRDGI